MYSWAPGVIAFTTTKGCLQVRNGERNSYIRIDKSEAGEITALLSHSLRKPTSLDELLQTASEDQRPSLLLALERLLSGSFVTSNLPEAGKPEAIYRIRIVGQSELAAEVEKALSTFGCIVERTELAADRYDNLPLNGDASDRPLLVANDGHELLLVAASENEWGMCRKIGRECAANGNPWALFRYVDGQFEAGPIILPGETACFDCLTLRKLSAANDYEAESEFLQYLSDANRSQINADPPRGSTQLAASVFANEVASFFLEGSDSGICNGLWSIGLRPLRFKHTRLLKIPGCPTCELGLGRLKGLASL